MGVGTQRHGLHSLTALRLSPAFPVAKQCGALRGSS